MSGTGLKCRGRQERRRQRGGDKMQLKASNKLGCLFSSLGPDISQVAALCSGEGPWTCGVLSLPAAQSLGNIQTPSVESRTGNSAGKAEVSKTLLGGRDYLSVSHALPFCRCRKWAQVFWRLVLGPMAGAHQGAGPYISRHSFAWASAHLWQHLRPQHPGKRQGR